MTKFLPLISQIGTRHGSRSFRTCALKCANQCDHAEPNTSGNEHIQTVMRSAFSRRKVLKVGAAGVAAAGIGTLAVNLPAAAEQPASAAGPDGTLPGFGPRGGLTHSVVPPNRKDDIVIPRGYEQAVIIGWGDPVLPGAPKFDVNKQTPEAQAKQFGYNNDYTMIVPLRDERKALLVCNHEYTDEYLMFPTGRYDDATTKKIAMAAHGMAVVGIERVGRSGEWRRDKQLPKYNRRITVDTEFEVTGPAAADARVGKKAFGTIGNCAGGITPWGTILSGEENFQGYFDVSGAVAAEHTTSFKRYGVPTTKTTQKGWSTVDARFDLAKTPTEAYRFGWIVEVDPYDPKSTPKKRSMLGRLKHEGATVTITADGRIAAYTGDDERGEYIYKFVSTGRYDEKNRKANFGLLDEGTLYVARFTGDGSADGLYDGTGQWIPLTSDKESFVPGMSVADVLINTRLAADKVSPTRMDRPEDIERNPVNGKVYAALTNNSNRGGIFGVDEANPLAKSFVRDTLDGPLVEKSGNRNGYVLELSEEGDDAAKTGFFWNLFLVCGDPAAQETYFGGFDKTKVSPISCPDNVAFDGSGNLWISTDGNVLGSNDGIFTVPVAGPNRGQVKQFLSVPFAAEACGPLISDDDRTAFVAVQHPGETDDATFEKPTSTWPHTHKYPRPAISCVWRKDGGRVGS
ncbi:PhoX family phosphatase [Kribbella turkmenica]|uniref:PhoX family phosphatase n=1 Tax=Kribbella turkmenica TaxID=2530375 RepID=A0A4R4X6C2_9ACTN|nr:PhoX family phosphatase [Kribbella turkmenica]TDD25845.1 PhoX family phosphatase [Kribbella turkmenica]